MTEALYYAYYQNIKHKAMSDLKQEYDKVKASGMFWEFYPTLSGEWSIDEPLFKLYKAQHMNRSSIHETIPQKKWEQKPVQENRNCVSHEQSEKVNIHKSPLFSLPEQDPKVFKPDYYRVEIKGVSIDVYDIATAFKLPPCLSNALKYILRAGNKENESTIKDLGKCLESIQRQLEYESKDLNG